MDVALPLQRYIPADLITLDVGDSGEFLSVNRWVYDLSECRIRLHDDWLLSVPGDHMLDHTSINQSKADQS
jgi:hypothetical protein